MVSRCKLILAVQKASLSCNSPLLATFDIGICKFVGIKNIVTYPFCKEAWLTLQRASGHILSVVSIYNNKHSLISFVQNKTLFHKIEWNCKPVEPFNGLYGIPNPHKARVGTTAILRGRLCSGMERVQAGMINEWMNYKIECNIEYIPLLIFTVSFFNL